MLCTGSNDIINLTYDNVLTAGLRLHPVCMTSLGFVLPIAPKNSKLFCSSVTNDRTAA